MSKHLWWWHFSFCLNWTFSYSERAPWVITWHIVLNTGYMFSSHCLEASEPHISWTMLSLFYSKVRSEYGARGATKTTNTNLLIFKFVPEFAYYSLPPRGDGAWHHRCHLTPQPASPPAEVFIKCLLCTSYPIQWLLPLWNQIVFTLTAVGRIRRVL